LCSCCDQVHLYKPLDSQKAYPMKY
jgi:hypothetical protein